MARIIPGYFDVSKGGSLSILPEVQQSIDKTLLKLAQDCLFKDMILEVDLVKEEFKGLQMINRVQGLRDEFKRYIKRYVPANNEYSEEVSTYLSKKFTPYLKSITIKEILMEVESYIESKGLLNEEDDNNNSLA